MKLKCKVRFGILIIFFLIQSVYCFPLDTSINIYKFSYSNLSKFENTSIYLFSKADNDTIGFMSIKFNLGDSNNKYIGRTFLIKNGKEEYQTQIIKLSEFAFYSELGDTLGFPIPKDSLLFNENFPGFLLIQDKFHFRIRDNLILLELFQHSFSSIKQVIYKKTD